MKKIQDYLEKAGFDVAASTLFKQTAIVAAIVTVVFYVTLYTPSGVSLTSVSFWVSTVTLFLGFFPAFYILFLLFLFVIVDFQITKRKQDIERIFPDFLHSVAANLRSGMPTDRAIWQSVTPQFGVLGKEIELVAKKNMTGIELAEALRQFSRRYESKLLQRSVSLIIEGLNAGSKLEVLLKNLAINLEDLQLRRQEMAASLTSYVFFISFAVLIAAPLMFGFATQFLVIIQNIGEKIDFESTDSLAISINFSAEAVSQSDFMIFAIVNLLISSILASIIVSQIQTGKKIYALPRIPVFFIVTLVLFWGSSTILGNVFAGII